MTFYLIAGIVLDEFDKPTDQYTVNTDRPIRRSFDKAQSDALEMARLYYAKWNNLEFTWKPDPYDDKVLILSVTHDTEWEINEPIEGGMKIEYWGGTVSVPAWKPTGVVKRETEEYCAVVTMELDAE